MNLCVETLIAKHIFGKYFFFINIKKNYHNSDVRTQKTQNICITFVQRRSNVFDIVPTLYICYTDVLCLLGYALIVSPHNYNTPCLPGSVLLFFFRIDFYGFITDIENTINLITMNYR